MCCFRGMTPTVYEIGPDDGPIIAWRGFEIWSRTGYSVRSPWRLTRWDQPEIKLGRFSTGKRASVGIYARKNRADVFLPNGRWPLFVVAKVELRGTVCRYDSPNPHRDGYRAQECRVLEIILPPSAAPDTAAKIKKLSPEWRKVRVRRQ